MRISGINIQNDDINILNGEILPTANIHVIDLSVADIDFMHRAYSSNLPCRLISYNNDGYVNKYKQPDRSELKIERVIFNDPATIVFWSDKTKTVVKCDNKDRFSEEMGLAMACAKKLLGNNYTYYGKFDKALEKAKRQKEDKV